MAKRFVQTDVDINGNAVNEDGYTAIEFRVFAPLAVLGRTQQAIARKLRIMGVTGNKGSETSCPLANVLKSAYPGLKCKVSGDTMEVDGAEVALPEEFTNFVHAFDQGDYPALIRGKK